MNTAVGKTACPRCQQRGNDTSGDNLVIYDDDSTYCFACGFHKRSAGEFNTQGDEVQLMPDWNMQGLFEKRKISIATLKRYGVTLKRGEDNRFFVCFPIVDAANQPAGEQRRTVDTTNGTLSREMTITKGTKLTNPLFGSTLIKKSTKVVLICEGQMDTLAAASAITDKTIVAVGIVGAMAAKKAAAQLLRRTGDYQIVLGFDNDDAGSEGKEAFVKYIREHEPGRALYALAIPKSYKDINDWLLGDADVDFAAEVHDASTILSDDIIGAREIGERLADYVRKLKHNKYIQLKFSATLSKTVRLMSGKLIGVVGDSGKGKSTLVEHMLLEAMAQGFNCFFVSAEMRAEEVGLKLARTVRGVDYYSEQVLEKMDDSEIDNLQQFTEKLTDKLNMFARFGQCGLSEINDRLYELEVAGRKPDIVAIDHMLAIAGEGSTEELETIAKSLKSMAEVHDCCIILLAHTRKPPQTNNPRTIYRPKLSDVYNSGGLSRYADVVLGVALDKHKSVTMVETIKLERMGGGYADVSLKMEDWQLVEVLDKRSTDDKIELSNDEEAYDDDYTEEEVF